MDISQQGSASMADKSIRPGPREGALAEPPRRPRAWKGTPGEARPKERRISFKGKFDVVEDTRRVSHGRRANWDNEPFIQALREGKTLFVPVEEELDGSTPDDARPLARGIAGSYYARLRRFGLRLRIHSERDGVVVWAIPLDAEEE
jgi:hypothetical protein